jgi:transcriptional regulator GlxA family with amidase domain
LRTFESRGARNLMEQSRHPIDVVARQTGFSDRDHMRRAFLRAFGQPPQVLRRNARLEGVDFREETQTAGKAVA